MTTAEGKGSRGMILTHNEAEARGGVTDGDGYCDGVVVNLG